MAKHLQALFYNNEFLILKEAEDATFAEQPYFLAINGGPYHCYTLFTVRSIITLFG
jgi:hypothetical protein